MGARPFDFARTLALYIGLGVAVALALHFRQPPTGAPPPEARRTR